MTNLLLTHGSYLGIIVFLILTGAGLPLPEEVAIVAAGVLSSPAIDQLKPGYALLSCLFGALTGDCVMYWIGHHFGRRVLREHHWWNRFVKPEREAQMEQMLQNHGFKVLFLARFLVGIRSPVYLSAGILRMPFWRFMLIDLFCATTVISTFFGLSYYFGDAIYRWIRRGEYTVTAVAAVAALAAGIYLWRRHVRHAAAQSAAESQQPVEGSKPTESSREPRNDEMKDRTPCPPAGGNGTPDPSLDARGGKTVSDRVQ